MKWIGVCLLMGFTVWLIYPKPIVMHPPMILHWSEDVLYSLSSEQLAQMLAAGEQLKKYPNVIQEILPTHGNFYAYDHYPEGNVVDENSQSEYYYHAHRPNEHGHFHVFKRDGKTHNHLIGISMDENGCPKSLFTVNQWVTGDEWKKAKELRPFLQEFKTPNPWLNAIICLFTPQIEVLLQARDRVLAEGGSDFQKDRSFEVLSEMEISIPQQVEWVSNLSAQAL